MNRDVIRRWKRDTHPTARPLSTRAIVLWAVFVLGVAVTSAAVLWWLYRGAEPRVQLDAIRTASAITVGAGGAVALLLAARRQRSTEETLEHQRQTLEHQREVAAATERDAAEQRITELYTRAVDQLGAEKAPVRLGGLHALERLAQNTPAQRQTIVDVICSYLRMPFASPGDQAPGEDAPEDAHSRYEQRRQELQVRLTAQRILSAHLKPAAAEVFWADIDLDLTEAHLHELDLRVCRVRTVQFSGAEFAGYARFEGAEFAGGYAAFGRAKFAEYAAFGGAEFAGEAAFGGAEFAEVAGFDGAKFAGEATFGGAKFNGRAGFDGAKFTGYAEFREAEFNGGAAFGGRGAALGGGAAFAGYARFDGAKFNGRTAFDGAKFTGNPGFHGARVAPNSRPVVLPTGWTTRTAQPAEGEEEDWLYVVRDEDSSEQPAEASDGPA